MQKYLKAAVGLTALGLLTLLGLVAGAETMTLSTISGGNAQGGGGTTILSGVVGHYGLATGNGDYSQGGTIQLTGGYYGGLTGQVYTRQNSADPVWLELSQRMGRTPGPGAGLAAIEEASHPALVAKAFMAELNPERRWVP